MARGLVANYDNVLCPVTWSTQTLPDLYGGEAGCGRPGAGGSELDACLSHKCYGPPLPGLWHLWTSPKSRDAGRFSNLLGPKCLGTGPAGGPAAGAAGGRA